MSKTTELLTAMLNDEPIEDFTPRSRIEAYLKNCCLACGCDGLPEPITETDKLLFALAEKVPTLGGGAASVPEKDVNFYDYDGTCLYAYSVEEAQALTELPKLPEHEGLICQGWNYDLETIKEYNRSVHVGAMYITDDGATRLHFEMATDGRLRVRMFFNQTIQNGVSVDWGDGSPKETFSGTRAVEVFHEYAQKGKYIVSLMPSDDCVLTIGGALYSFSVLAANSSGNGAGYRHILKECNFGKNVTSIDAYTFQYSDALKCVSIPNTVASFGKYAFAYCTNMRYMCVPLGAKSIGSYALRGCSALSTISIPNSVETIGNYAFGYCKALSTISIPNSVETIDSDTFNSCLGLTSVRIPSSVLSMKNGSFSGCTGVGYYDFTTHTNVPTLSSTDALGTIPADCEIRVPAALYDEWIAATNWATYASQIVAV